MPKNLHLGPSYSKCRKSKGKKKILKEGREKTTSPTKEQ
jgi:hypothetical protein